MSAFNKQAGFSLLEILVAFVVMAFVVGVILQLFGTSMRSVALADEYSYAVQVAESHLAAVGTEIPVEAGEQSGKEKNSAYAWQIKMQPIEAATLNDKLEKLPLTVQLYQVESIVTWQQGDKPRSLQLTSLRFGKPQ